MAIPPMEDAAARLVETLVENASRRYERNPALLDMIAPGLSQQESACIVAVCESKKEKPRDGFGGVVQPVNLAGAIRYARRQMNAASAFQSGVAS